MRITLKNCLCHRANDTARRHRAFAAARRAARYAIGGKKRLVILLAFSYRRTRSHVLVTLNVNHGELLCYTGSVLQSHEVRRLTVHVDEQREGSLVTQVLDLTLGGSHGRSLGCTRYAVEMRLLRTLVHQHDADDRFVSRRRGDAGIHPHVVILGNVVVAQQTISARGGLHDVLLAQERVQPAIVVAAIPVVLLNEQVSRIDAVNPLGAILNGKILALARGGIAEHHAADSRAAKKTNGTRLNRANPPRMAIFVNLEGELVEHIERVRQLNMTIDVAEQRL